MHSQLEPGSVAVTPGTSRSRKGPAMNMFGTLPCPALPCRALPEANFSILFWGQADQRAGGRVCGRVHSCVAN
jgi:hypothetical protein